MKQVLFYGINIPEKLVDKLFQLVVEICMKVEIVLATNINVITEIENSAKE